MSKKRKIPAPKTTKPAPKKGATTKEAAPRDAAAPKTPATPREPKPRDPRLPLPGATLERTYKKKTYTLKFLDEGGVEVGGKVFGSLSAAARHVTGAASINGFLWAGLLARDGKGATRDASSSKGAKPKAPAAPKVGGDTNDFATPAGQRAALAAAGLAKKGKGAKAATPTDAAKDAKGA